MLQTAPTRPLSSHGRKHKEKAASPQDVICKVLESVVEQNTNIFKRNFCLVCTIQIRAKQSEPKPTGDEDEPRDRTGGVRTQPRPAPTQCAETNPRGWVQNWWLKERGNASERGSFCKNVKTNPRDPRGAWCLASLSERTRGPQRGVAPPKRTQEKDGNCG